MDRVLVRLLSELQPAITPRNELPYGGIGGCRFVSRFPPCAALRDQRDSRTAHMLLADIARLPRSSRRQQVEWSKAYRQWGDQEAFWNLVQSGLRTCIHVAAKYAESPEDFLENVQDGFFGLVRAAELYDYSRGIPFSAYGPIRIRQSIQRAANDRRLVRLPTYLVESLSRLRRKVRTILADTGAFPTLEEVGQESDHQALTNALASSVAVADIDGPAPPSGEPLLVQWYLGNELRWGRSGSRRLLSDSAVLTDPVDPEVLFLAQEGRDDLESLLETLPARSEQVLRLYYGFDDGRCRTLREIGSVFGFTHERARQIIVAALILLGKHEAFLLTGELGKHRRLLPARRAGRRRLSPCASKVSWA